MSPRIDILLSTYNSTPFLEELLFSLHQQTYGEWQLLVRDDRSQDNTLELLKACTKKYNIALQIVDNEGKNLGPIKSFEKLLAFSSADYTLFCDHDDYWLPTKLEDSLAEIQKIERKTPNEAALVFTDLQVVDEQLESIHPSFWEYSRVAPNAVFNTYKLLINNPAPGCTYIFNKALKEQCLPFPKNIRMHDWWMVLRASESGKITYLKKASILYRQHPENKVGAESLDGSYLKNRLKNLKTTWDYNLQSFKMMKYLEKDYSLLKLLYYKIRLTLTKLF